MLALTLYIAVARVQTNKDATHSLVRGCIIWEPEDSPNSFTAAGSSGDAVDDEGSAANFGCEVLLHFPDVCKYSCVYVCTGIGRIIYSVHDIYARLNIIHSS